MSLDLGAIVVDGLGNLPARFFQRADVQVNSGKLRAQAQHFTILLHGIARFLRRCVNVAQVVTRFDVARLDDQRLLIISDGIVPFFVAGRFVPLFEKILRSRRKWTRRKRPVTYWIDSQAPAHVPREELAAIRWRKRPVGAEPSRSGFSSGPFLGVACL